MNLTDAISIVMKGIKDGSISLVSGDGLVTPKKPRARWSKYIGSVFGSLKVIENLGNGKWLVECMRCCARIEKHHTNVKSLNAKCECQHKKNEHQIGSRYGNWILREKADRRWTIECELCGHQIKRLRGRIVAGQIKCVCHSDFDHRGSLVGPQKQLKPKTKGPIVKPQKPTKRIRTDRRFGNLFIREMLGTNDQGENIYQTKCLCGGDKIVTENELLSGHITHCGCKTKENK